MNLPSSRVYGGWLALVRVLTGLIWLIHGIPKFTNSAAFMPPSGFIVSYVQEGIGKTAGPYHDFLVGVVQPNIGIFAELVRLGEVCVGISLVLGLFTRLGGFFGIVLPLDYMAARGALTTFTDWSTVDACMALLSAISLVLPTGRVVGLDAFFSHRRVKATVVPEVVPERPMDRPTASP
ncbi:MAG TPA: TQO small subunit DoxD [Candidatus Binatia bacterium]|nr:TQO small subunit DoxD [Candidatus Binatia bacterium]